MKEIGGYLELERYSGSLYHDEALAMNCGRTCLEYLIRTKGIKKLYVPFFCCDSVKKSCEKCGIEIEFYHIDELFRPVFNKTLKLNEWLYVVNFYGQIDNQEVQIWKYKYKNLIFDNAQAYFQRPVDGVDTIYTCRKFLGVADGGFLYTDEIKEYQNLEQDESYENMRFILGRFERTANEFYKESVYNNHRFEKESMKKMSKLTTNLLRSFDYLDIVKRRENNFEFLNKELEMTNRVTLRVHEGPYMYPYYSECGEAIRKNMQEKKIYIPILWPEVLSNCDLESIEYKFALNILPLPIDQRYDEEDMKLIVNMLQA